jgi:NAD+ diphosphatase
MPPPSPPEAPYPLTNDPISRRFGPEPLNYFSVTPLNRVSFLRQDNEWLTKAFAHPDARYVLFQDLGVLTSSSTELHTVKWEEIASIFPGTPSATATAEHIFSKPAEEARTASFQLETLPPLVMFLGLDPIESSTQPPAHPKYPGRPLFALDITARAPFKDAAIALKEKFTAEKLSFIKDRLNLSFSARWAAVFAEARHLLDWHTRNPFCGGCGSRSTSIQGGWKRVCTSAKEVGCATKETPHTVSNLSFPRTDGAVIMAILSPTGTHLLLGRQARWPKGMYSTLAGFLEPGESVEDAVRREVWEESGVKVGRVILWGSQPWPFPANIMLGAIGVAIEGFDKIDLGLDKELEDGRWVPLQDIRESLAASGPWDGGLGASDATNEPVKEKIRVPPKTAIAHQLLDAVCNGGIIGSSGVKM